VVPEGAGRVQGGPPPPGAVPGAEALASRSSEAEGRPAEPASRTGWRSPATPCSSSNGAAAREFPVSAPAHRTHLNAAVARAPGRRPGGPSAGTLPRPPRAAAPRSARASRPGRRRRSPSSSCAGCGCSSTTPPRRGRRGRRGRVRAGRRDSRRSGGGGARPALGLARRRAPRVAAPAMGALGDSVGGLAAAAGAPPLVVILVGAAPIGRWRRPIGRWRRPIGRWRRPRPPPSVPVGATRPRNDRGVTPGPTAESVVGLGGVSRPAGPPGAHAPGAAATAPGTPAGSARSGC